MLWIWRAEPVSAVTLQEADQGNTTTVVETLARAGQNAAELIGTEEPNQQPPMPAASIVVSKLGTAIVTPELLPSLDDLRRYKQ
jgi:bifunctional ADP-heptose synthase (sugar kinase/adenylyltransferase)